MRNRLAVAFALALLVAVLPTGSTSAQVVGTDITYTTDADFDQGTLVSVNHDAPNNDQLQLDSPTEPFPFINVAASGRGTVVRINTDTGEVVGEYRTAPEGRGLDPSRTTVDLFGSVWTANRDEVGEIEGVPHGSAVKIGLIAGGTRVDAAGTPDPAGEYLAPPFGYSTCSDRDGDGLIRTSNGLLHVLDWPDVTDGLGGPDGLVDDAVDECILIYQRLPDAEQARHVSVDADNNVWVGGYPFDGRMFYKLDGSSGAILDWFDARDFGCGGYGGLIDGNGVLWSIGGGFGEGPLLRYDPATRTGMCVNTYGGYGLGIDTNGFLWASLWNNGIAKVSPDGVLQAGFPKSTWPTSTAAAAAFSKPVREPMEALPAMALMQQAETSTFQVSPMDDWVQSSGTWPAGSTISLTIEDGSGVVYADSRTADVDGFFNFHFGGMFDLQRGHAVTVSDGITTKTHTVIDLFIDGVDLVDDVIVGRANPGSDVDVWVDGYDGLTVTPDGSGNWTADFSGLVDITQQSTGGSQQSDMDGDSTYVWWSQPQFQVSPMDDWVQSSGTWPAGSTISLTIEDGSGVVYADSRTADVDGFFNFHFGGMFDLQRGHAVTVSDGITTKTHTVIDLFIDGVDLVDDVIVGRANPGSDVDVWVDGYDGLTVTPDGSGNWTADFSGLVDITQQSTGGSQQHDADNDSTYVWWSQPQFQVSPMDDWVQSSGTWPAGSTISLTIEDGSGVVYADSRTADVDGFFNFHFGGMFDLQRGHAVTVSDGITTKTHTVIDLFIDGVDLVDDVIVGRANPGSDVDVWVDGYDGLTVTPDGSGNWTADFSGLVDITQQSTGGSQQSDMDGDSTYVWFAYPSFQVAPQDDWVQSQNPWAPGATISLTIEDGSGLVYADTQTADGAGHFNYNLWDVFDIERGHIVTVSDGSTTKMHTVEDLFVDGVNVIGDTVFGRADPGSSVDVWVHGDGGVTATADGSGNWIADFSGMTDLTYLSDGGSQQFDDDGDSTGVWWASPRFQVAPQDDWVQSYNRWTAGATISLTIADSGSVVYTDSQTADTNGNFNFNLQGIFDLQRGHLVTVSDGTTTKVHTVEDLFVDGVNVIGDTVFGRADPGSSVDVWVHGDGGVTATADGSGNWIADFSGMTDLTYLSDGGSQQFDDDGDSTGVWWASPRFQVAPQDDWVQSYNRWTAGATISLTIADSGSVVYTDSQTADTNGNFNFNLQGIFDLQRGHLVTVSDGTVTKTHTVTDVTVPDGSINVGADTVAGTAEPGAWVQVGASLFQEWSGRWVQADSGGNWTADFSIASEDQPAYDITEATFIDVEEFDDDGDATYRRFGPPVQANRGVAVTPIDNHVWVANSFVETVTRLDNDGNILKVIEVGNEPTGVAVDAAGKVWVTNLGSDNTMRIDPNAGSDGLGAVDLTVDLGPGASPYNYSDMTGAVVIGSTSPQGFWTVVQDSREAGFEWGRLTWNTEPEGEEPEGTEIVVEVRTADSEAGLGGATFLEVTNAELFSSYGRYIEVRVTLKASPGGLSPVLSDIRVQPAIIEVPVDVKPTSCPNPFNVDKKGVMPVAILGTDNFDVNEIDPATVMLEDVAPLRWLLEDVATPFEPYLGKADAYDCNEYGPDGYMDLTFKFDAREVAAALGDVADGDVLVLNVTGFTLTGIPIVGEDVVVILKK